MTIISRIRGRRCGRAASRCAHFSDKAGAIAQRRAASSSASRTRPAHRCRRCCAPRWKPPSAPPMPTAPGTGRRPTTPARRRPSCSCASSARPCAREADFAGRDAADAGKDRRPSSHPHPPLRGERGAPAVLDADRAWLRGEHRGRDHAGRSSCWSLGRHRAARHPRRARRRARSFSTSSPRPAPALLAISFRASPSRASTPRRSTIISTPASCRASC